MPDPYTHKDKTARMARLLEVQDEIAARLARGMVGQTFRVLVEGHARQEGMLTGRLDNNLIVEFAADPACIGQYAEVLVEDARATVLKGRLAD